jgi:hypothetical protein
MTTNYTKWPKIIPNGCQTFQMVMQYNNIFNSKALKNISKLGFIFGFKINHLATLLLIT